MFIAAPLVLYAARPSQPDSGNVVDRIIFGLTSPIQAVVTRSFDGVRNIWTGYIALTDLAAENQALRRENLRLQQALASRTEEHHENERLRLLVGLQDRVAQAKMVFAEVIGTAPTPLFRALRVNRGEAHGVGVGDVVMTEAGLVGRVATTGWRHADVMLLVDANSSVDVLVQRTRARARIRGAGDNRALGIDVQYLLRTADVEPGDVLISSGVGSVFPKGLQVGRVVSVEKGAFGLYQGVSANPVVDFSRLEAVLILPRGWPEDISLELPGPPLPEPREMAWKSDTEPDTPKGATP